MDLHKTFYLRHVLLVTDDTNLSRTKVVPFLLNKVIRNHLLFKIFQENLIMSILTINYFIGYAALLILIAPSHCMAKDRNISGEENSSKVEKIVTLTKIQEELGQKEILQKWLKQIQPSSGSSADKSPNSSIKPYWLQKVTRSRRE